MDRAGYELTVGEGAVSGVCEPLPVVPCLWAVLRNREAGEFAAAGTDLGYPLDQRNGQHRFRIGGPGVSDERITTVTRGRTRVSNALEVPIVATVVRVDLPVVTCRIVPAVAIQRCVELVELRGRRVRDAVDVRVDAMPVGCGINGDRNARTLRNRRERAEYDGGRNRGDSYGRPSIPHCC